MEKSASKILCIENQQNHDDDEFAEMLSWNLAKTVHNKSLQSLGYKSNDLHSTTLDEYVWVIIQVVAYYQFLKGDVGDIGPSKEELKPRNALCHARVIGDPRVLKDAMDNIPGAGDICSFEANLKGKRSQEKAGSTAWSRRLIT